MRLADPAFELSAESAALVPQIVVRLDGLPLAIELAAARVESFGMAQLYTRLAAPFGVLTQGSRTAPVRHRSLRATVDWSYQLMSDPLRRVFRRLAILPGPFTLRAAAALAGSEAESSVSQLVDCSLLTPPRVGVDERARYLMLETVRAFALEQLDESGERDDAAEAMMQFAAQLAAAAADGIGTAGGEAAAASQLDAEEPLLREALTWALEHDAALALRLAVALAPWWQLRGRVPDRISAAGSGAAGLSGPRRRVARRAQVAGSPGPQHGRVRACAGALRRGVRHGSPRRDRHRNSSTDSPDGPGRCGIWAGWPKPATPLTRRCEAAEQLHYAEGQAHALTQLSLAADYADEAESATRWARQAAEIDPTRISDRLARRVRVCLTVGLADSNDLEAARDVCAEGLESARAAGDVTMQADFLSFTTHIALRLGSSRTRARTSSRRCA